MTRRAMLNSCLSGCVSGSLILATGLLSAQQPGRATLQPRNGAPRGTSAAQQPSEEAPRVERPPAGNLEPPLSKELENLLVQWEKESGKIDRLRGDFERYVYDMVYLAEQRAVGTFHYLAPDKGRMDFGPVKDDERPPRVDKVKGNFQLQVQPKQRWICNGKTVCIIDDDQKLYDLIHIPAQQQGRNIINGPLPFLFGMKAEQAKARYRLDVGDKHLPEGKVVTGENGKPVRLAPQLHIVAIPKRPHDRAEWQRADVLLTRSFLPRAIRLINATGTKETSYVFYPESAPGAAMRMVVNERFWLKDPFDDGPPAGYTKNSESRASDEETSVGTNRVVPAAAKSR
jgi:hypothetical protein